jgi:hypothetical protein
MVFKKLELKNINDVGDREEYLDKISKKLPIFGDLHYIWDISRA